MRKVVLIAIVLMAAAGLALLGQTSIRLSMISGPVSPGAILVLAPNGTITFAAVGSGIALVQGPTGYVLQVQAVNRVVGAKPARQSDGSYLLTQTVLPATLQVYRNGVRQSPGDDYLFEPATRKIVPVVGYPWDGSDLILADLEY